MTRVIIGVATQTPSGDANETALATTDAIAPHMSAGAVTPALGGAEESMLECNVDDLDPRVWPGVLADLLTHGASDAWLSQILMKKGRPAHTLHVLTNPLHVELLLDRIYQLVPTLGVRAFSVSKHALDRVWRDIDLPDGRARIKLGVHKGRIVSATPEFDDIAQLSQKTGIAVRVLLDLCSTEASSLGLRPGAVLNEI